MGDYYVLREKKPVKLPSGDEGLIAWAKEYEGADRHVAETWVKPKEIRVSTVFLGLDHSFGQGPPLLFETMIFGGPQDGYQDRYSTWEEAEAGHAKAVKASTQQEDKDE